MLAIRVALPSDQARVAAFYRRTGYSLSIVPSDRILIAERGDEIVGALRLCAEDDVLVLRGMRVLEGARRQGIGSSLLVAAQDLMAQATCYCIPHDYLEAFYARIGFRKVPLREAPSFLQDRWREYGRRGLNVILMKRES